MADRLRAYARRILSRLPQVEHHRRRPLALTKSQPHLRPGQRLTRDRRSGSPTSRSAPHATAKVATVTLKASGPLALGEREPSERALRVISLVAPAVLTGLVVYETFGHAGGGLTVDERVVGLAAAAAAIAARAPMAAVIVIAAAATAASRAIL